MTKGKDTPPQDDSLPRDETDMPEWAQEDDDNRIWTDGTEGDSESPTPRTKPKSEDDSTEDDTEPQDGDSESDDTDEDDTDVADTDVADSDGPVITEVIVDDDGNRVTVEDDTDVADDSEEDSEDEEDDTDEDDTDEDDTDEDDTDEEDTDEEDGEEVDDPSSDLPEGQSVFGETPSEPTQDADADAESDKTDETVENTPKTDDENKPKEDEVGTPEPISEERPRKGHFCALFKYSPRKIGQKIKYWFTGTEDNPLPVFSYRARFSRWYKIHFRGHVYLRTLDYNKERNEYILHVDLIRRRDVPKSAVHCTGEKNTFLVSSFKVPYEPWKDNGFGAVNAYLYMKDLSLDEALLMSYQYPKVNGKMLLIIGIIAMSAVFYIMFMMR